MFRFHQPDEVFSIHHLMDVSNRFPISLFQNLIHRFQNLLLHSLSGMSLRASQHEEKISFGRNRMVQLSHESVEFLLRSDIPFQKAHQGLLLQRRGHPGQPALGALILPHEKLFLFQQIDHFLHRRHDGVVPFRLQDIVVRVLTDGGIDVLEFIVT